MNDEIVTRLREHAQNCDCTNASFDMDAAADEIERLQAEIVKLKTDRNPT
jgi:HAMP domain-containing protein